MSNIGNQVCQAIEIMVDRALTQAQFDKTIKGTIVNLVDSKTGKYKVRYQDDLIYAYAGTADMDFNTGDEVYILVPQGNFSGDKTILGTTRRIGDAAGDEYIISENDKYEIIGNNILPETSSFNFLSYDAYNANQTTFAYPELNPYKTGAAPNVFPVDAEGLIHYLKIGKYLVISANFATNFPKTQWNSGNYGVDVKLDFLTQSSGIATYTYRIDVNSIQGFPWGLGADGITQTFYFEMPDAEFKGLNSISMFIENFATEMPTEGTVPQWDLWIKNLSISAANRIPDEDLNSYFVRLLTKQGCNFSETNVAPKTIEAHLYEKGKDISNTSNIEYYWFYQRADVTTQHENYCSYGGEGWYCLNETFPLSEDGTRDRKWKPAINSYIVNKENVVTQRKIYKCVVLYNGVVVEKQVIMFRDDVEWSMALATTTGETVFFRDEGSTEITCTIYDNKVPILDSSKCTFKWMTLNYLNKAILNDSTGKVLSVDIKDIVYSSTYLCSAFIEGEYIGTDSITLTNTGEDLNAPRYTLLLINGSQLFQYDEYGLSPAHESQKAPITINTLQLVIVDNKTGEQLKVEETAATTTIYVPREGTMIKPKGSPLERIDSKEPNFNLYSYPSTGFAFDIVDNYNFRYKNNTLKVVVIYNKTTLIGYTDFVFIKQGEDGTNGTNFVCRIVPNYKDTTQDEYHEWISWVNNEDGSRSYNFEPGQDADFTVELTETGTLIESAIVKQWSALARKYTYAISENSLIAAGASPGYLSPSDTAPNSSILQAEVVYGENTYYASLPIVDIRRKSFNYNFEVKGGFHDVVYKADGTNPQYNSEPFSIVVTDLDGNEVVDVVYEWSEMGQIYDTRDGVSKWYEAKLLKQDYNSTTTDKNFLIRPASKYDGLCLSTGVQCVISKDSTELATIFIPIHFYLNRFGHSAINGWNGNDIVTDNESGIILSPQFGAGEKDTNNRFTGLVMGAIKDSAGKKKTGLVGYGDGFETLFISAEDGSASFGVAGSGQIRLIPGTKVVNGEKEFSGDAIIEGGAYKQSDTDGSGMQINLTEPSIRYGNGNFKVNEDGLLTAKGADINGRVTIDGDFSCQGQKFQVTSGNGEILFNDFSARISGRNMNINLQEGKITFNGGTLNGDGDTEDTFYGYVAADGFRFGNKNLEKNENGVITKGGYIKYTPLGGLEISGSFEAATGSIGGWKIEANELKSKAETIRLYSGSSDEKGEDSIPAFISIKDSDGEFSVSSGSKKIALRKGGMYLYSESFALDDEDKKEKLNNWYGRIYANDTSDSLSISTQEKRPIIFWGANISVPDEDGKDIEEDRVLMCMRPGDTKAEDYIQIGARKTGETSTYTRLYYNGIHVRDITPYKQMDTKATTIVDAINEIYPGGPLNIQHAVAVLPENKLDILYDYTIVTHTHSAEIGYGPYQNAIYVQGYKMTDFPKPGASASSLTADFNDFKRRYPQTEFYNAISGKFFCLQQKTFVDDEDASIGFDEYSSLVTNIVSVFYETVNQEEGYFRDSKVWDENHRTTYCLKADGINITRPDYQKNLYFTPGSNLIPINGGLTISSQFALIWNRIYSPGGGVNKYDLGYGYIEGSINTFSVRQRLTTLNASWVFGGGEQPSSNWFIDHYMGTSYDYWAYSGTGTAPIRIPFTSQAEYDAAVNLLAIDAKLYEVQQNKGTG